MEDEPLWAASNGANKMGCIRAHPILTFNPTAIKRLTFSAKRDCLDVPFDGELPRFALRKGAGPSRRRTTLFSAYGETGRPENIGPFVP